MVDNRRRPPHGGRGLKSGNHVSGVGSGESSSTRRTWIEMQAHQLGCWFCLVVLHTEDVD